MNDKFLVDVDDAVVTRISEALACAFPGHKFVALKCDSSFPRVFNNVEIRWLDGPSEAEVWSVIRTFEGKDGLQFVSGCRNFSDDLVQECIDRLRKEYGQCNVPPSVTVEKYRRNDLEKICTARFPGNISVAIDEMGIRTSKYRRNPDAASKTGGPC
ncbi:hypothetical protein JDS34_20675 [Escherichia coli]|nr:hypothetical protein [Escherichia coli]